MVRSIKSINVQDKNIIKFTMQIRRNSNAKLRSIDAEWLCVMCVSVKRFYHLVARKYFCDVSTNTISATSVVKILLS